MIDLYFWPTPNGWKLSIALEELGLPYTVKPVNIGRGEQFGPAFLAISPNNRIPAMVDHAPADGGPPLSSFETGAMLLYLAEKTGQLLPTDARGRHAVLPWLMWQMGGLGPMLGQHGHFKLYAPEPLPYAIARYAQEARRLYGVLNTQLAHQRALGHDHVAGAYSIADIAIFPWAMTHKAQGFSLDDWPEVKRWYALLRARDAVQRGLAVGRDWRPSKALDAEAKKNLFGTGGPGAADAATDAATDPAAEPVTAATKAPTNLPPNAPVSAATSRAIHPEDPPS